MGSKAWVGHDCETDVDECDEMNPLHDCDPNADCVNLAGSFACECREHWVSCDESGSGRENPGCCDYHDCGEEPCQNGATCNEGNPGCQETDADGNIVIGDCYTCTCAYGWTGFDCEIDENECDGSEGGDYLTIKESCHDEAFCS